MNIHGLKYPETTANIQKRIVNGFNNSFHEFLDSAKDARPEVVIMVSHGFTIGYFIQYMKGKKIAYDDNYGAVASF